MAQILWAQQLPATHRLTLLSGMAVLYLTMAIDMNPRDGVAHIIRIVRRQSGMIGRELHIAMDQGNQTMGERRKRGPSIARHR